MGRRAIFGSSWSKREQTPCPHSAPCLAPCVRSLQGARGRQNDRRSPWPKWNGRAVVGRQLAALLGAQTRDGFLAVSASRCATNVVGPPMPLSAFVGTSAYRLALESKLSRRKLPRELVGDGFGARDLFAGGRRKTPNLRQRSKTSLGPSRVQSGYGRSLGGTLRSTSGSTKGMKSSGQVRTDVPVTPCPEMRSRPASASR